MGLPRPDCCEADQGVDRTWIQFERPFEIPSRLLPGRGGVWAIVPGPPPHDQITRSGIEPCFAIYPRGCRFDEIEAETVRCTKGDLVLRLI